VCVQVCVCVAAAVVVGWRRSKRVRAPDGPLSAIVDRERLGVWCVGGNVCIGGVYVCCDANIVWILMGPFASDMLWCDVRMFYVIFVLGVGLFKFNMVYSI